MITASGKVISKPSRPSYQNGKQSIQIVNGSTMVNCGVCGKLTNLYHEAKINTGRVFYRESTSGKFVGITWVESTKKVGFPEIIRRWVCADHYRQVTFTSTITGKQVIVVEPIWPESKPILGLNIKIENGAARLENNRVRAQERILGSPLNDPYYKPPVKKVLTQAEHKRKWDEWW